MKKQIHFIGIKGVGMTALALYAKEKGFLVSGSDEAEEFLTDAVLKKHKISFKVGFNRKDLKIKPDLVIVTGAHGGLTNKEAQAFREEGVEVISHGQALGRFLNEQQGISVAGVGGKTTTSAMIATILSNNQLDPSYVVGVADIFPLGQPGHFGRGKYFVAEADEYAACPQSDPTPRFLYQKPQVEIITNIEYDHPDIYRSLEETFAAFSSFVENMDEEGLLVINGDNAHNRSFIKTVRKKTQSYGFSPDVSYQIENVKFQTGRTKFSLKQDNLYLGEYEIQVPGKFNVLNATASIVVGLHLGLTTQQIKSSLYQFLGTKRRFEFIGDKGKLKIYDDYAHHPSEIKMTLMAVHEWFPDYKILCLFQPHTYSRTKSLLNEFAQSFGFADEVIVLPIFASAREKYDPEFNSSFLTAKINLYHPRAFFEADEKKIIERLQNISEKTIVLTMGAGDIYKLGPKILNQI